MLLLAPGLSVVEVDELFAPYWLDGNVFEFVVGGLA